MEKTEKDKFTRDWITERAIGIVAEYAGNITLRALHYRLVALGMTNSQNHYKRVIAAMTKARWNSDVRFGDFKDHERSVLGMTNVYETTVDAQVDHAKRQIRAWATSYRKNRWENQEYYPEVFIEKKALQGTFEPICEDMDVALCPCKGYPSLTYMHDAANRFTEAQEFGKRPIILYFGDYDPSGEDIPRSIRDTLSRMDVDVEVKRIALMEHQVKKWKLPPAPTKMTDSRSSTWDGLGQVELDAVEPKQIQQLCKDAIMDIFDIKSYDDLMIVEYKESKKFKKILKGDIGNLLN